MMQRIMMLRDCAAVKRSHTCRTLIDHTLASHSHGVAMLVLEVYRYAEYSTVGPSANILAASLVHDLSERVSGDMPATAKWANPKLKAELNVVSMAWENKHSMRFELSLVEQQVLKWCDLMEFGLTMIEERKYGNTFVDEYLRNCLEGFKSLSRPLRSMDTLMIEFIESLKQFGVEL